MRSVRTLAVAFALVLQGCFEKDLCDEACPPPAPDPCEGQCAPFVGGEWEPVLVASASTAPAPPCPPDVAPFETMRSTAPPVTACGVHEEDGACSSPGYVCLPSAPPPWSVCVLRDGDRGCPEPYTAPVDVDADSGVTTVCCLAPAGDPA